MRVALELVRDGRAHACVSAGNGAPDGAVAAPAEDPARYRPPCDGDGGSDREGALSSALLGANVDCSAEHLWAQFAVMGAVAVRALGCVSPWVALLNVGTEEIKGNQQVKLAASLLQKAQGLNFSGYRGRWPVSRRGRRGGLRRFRRQHPAEGQRRPGYYGVGADRTALPLMDWRRSWSVRWRCRCCAGCAAISLRHAITAPVSSDCRG